MAAPDPLCAIGRGPDEVRPDGMVCGTDREQWTERVFPRLRLHRPYGNFSELNVAQVGHGIGSFAR